MVSGIYCITNTLNGKRYVGSAAPHIHIRWKGHRCMLRKGNHHSSHLQCAWDKYGEEVFEFRVLFYWPSHPKQDFLDMETAVIAAYKTCDPKFGYNTNPTAGSNFGRHWSSETKKKLSEAMKGRIVSQETREKQRIAGLKRKTSEATKEKIRKKHIGKKISEETRKKISESLKETFAKPEIKEKLRNRPNQNHSGMKGKHHTLEARNKMSEKRSGIGNVMYGKHHTKETKDKIRKANSKLSPAEVKEIRKVWSEPNHPSQSQLAKKYGVSKGCIQGIVDGVNWRGI